MPLLNYLLDLVTALQYNISPVNCSDQFQNFLQKTQEIFRILFLKTESLEDGEKQSDLDRKDSNKKEKKVRFSDPLLQVHLFDNLSETDEDCDQRDYFDSKEDFTEDLEKSSQLFENHFQHQGFLQQALTSTQGYQPCDDQGNRFSFQSNSTESRESEDSIFTSFEIASPSNTYEDYSIFAAMTTNPTEKNKSQVQQETQLSSESDKFLSLKSLSEDSIQLKKNESLRERRKQMAGKKLWQKTKSNLESQSQRIEKKPRSESLRQLSDPGPVLERNPEQPQSQRLSGGVQGVLRQETLQDILAINLGLHLSGSQEYLKIPSPKALEKKETERKNMEKNRNEVEHFQAEDSSSSFRESSKTLNYLEEESLKCQENTDKKLEKAFQELREKRDLVHQSQRQYLEMLEKVRTSSQSSEQIEKFLDEENQDKLIFSTKTSEIKKLEKSKNIFME